MSDRKWILWRTASAFVHLFGAVVYVSTFLWTEFAWNRRDLGKGAKRDPIGGWKFLTQWNHLLQSFIFFLLVIADMVSFINGRRKSRVCEAGSETQPSQRNLLQKASDLFVHSLAFPVGTFVAILYWTLIFINPELIAPRKALEHLPPPIVQYSQHILVGVLIVVENLLHYHERPNWKVGSIPLTIFLVAYTIWVHYVGYVHKSWAYGILAKLDDVQRLAFVGGCLVFGYVLYWLGGIIHRFWWTAERKSHFDNGFSQKDADYRAFRVREA